MTVPGDDEPGTPPAAVAADVASFGFSDHGPWIVDPDAMVWRMTMMIGAYLYVISDPNRLEQLSNGRCDAKDPDELVRQFTAFFTGGFMAPIERRDERLPAMVA
jgi:hypothetical protein